MISNKHLPLIQKLLRKVIQDTVANAVSHHEENAVQLPIIFNDSRACHAYFFLKHCKIIIMFVLLLVLQYHTYLLTMSLIQ